METNERCWLYLNENASRRTQKKKTKTVRKKSNLPTTLFLIFNIFAFISLLAFGIIVSNKQQEKLTNIEKQVATLNESQRSIPNTATSTPVVSSSNSYEEEQSTSSNSSATPHTEESTETSETSQEVIDTPVTPSTYTVQQGDTLSTIAERNNLTVQAIKEKNNLTDDIVYIGQVLELS